MKVRSVENTKLRLLSRGAKALFHPIIVGAALICVPPSVRAQHTNFVFQHFSAGEGLSSVAVRCIYQDSVGYLWFGTLGGIDRYDGYSFTTYKHDPDDTASLVNAFVNTLCEDRAGNLWVGTYAGLDRLDRASGTFTHYLPHPSDLNSDQGNFVNSIHEDRDGLLWIGTNDGLKVFDRSNGKFTCFRDDSTDPGGGVDNSIQAICEDRAGLLWIGTRRGLNRFDKESEKFIHYWHDFNHLNHTDKWISSIYEDASGILWLGGSAGLVAFDQRAGTFTQYAHDPKDPRSLSSNEVTSISEDKAGQLWVGTKLHGVNVFDRRTKSFNHYGHSDKDPGSLSSNGTWSVYCERSGTIWVSTPDKGINKLNRAKPPFTSYPYDDQAPLTEFPQVFADNVDRIWVHASNEWKKFDPRTATFLRQPLDKDSYPLFDDRAGNLWIGKDSGGLDKRDYRGHTTSVHDPAGLRFRQVVYCFIETRDGSFWLGTTDGGLYAVDPATNSVKRVQEGGSEIQNILEDSYGLLWIGTWNDGLLCYDPRKETVVRYRYDPRNPSSLSANVVLTVYEDKTGTLWVGANGLDRFDRATGTFTHFTAKDGLPGDPVGKIMEDDHGNLWLGTGKGISKFDPRKISFKNYDVSYGLADNAIRIQSGCKTKNGEMYFGGKGLTRFHPDSIRDNLYVPPIVITQFRLFEKPVPFTKEVNLSYRNNFISFDFSALSYLSPENNQYAYRMEGIDSGWVYAGTRRYASYPHLTPGEYVFRVKGSNNDGLWNEEGTSVAITISPPFWNTWWAYATYVLIILILLYGLRRYEMNRQRFKFNYELERVGSAKLKELDTLKSRFFANISHEFRTPLTLILGPIEKWRAKTVGDDLQKDLGMMERNAHRLLRLINQLLDLSKIEAGGMKLQAAREDIVPFIKGITQSFQSSAGRRSIALRMEIGEEKIDEYFDHDKVEKILTNLLSNAFKFTREGGEVKVCVRRAGGSPSVPAENGCIDISVADTGIGISQEELPRVFDRFYQVDSSQTRGQEGSGIGLALTKELVEAYHGTISVTSEVGKGTEFTVRLPASKAQFTPEEIVDAGTTLQPPAGKEDVASFAESESIARVVVDDTSQEKALVLIVEDNPDVRAYVRDCLGAEYRILEARDGHEGVAYARESIPDLIISDVMMPQMDGNELCRTLKLDEKTSHVPVVLLTAKAGQENKIEGLETGADDFLVKPFDARELRVRVSNLIELRRKLRKRFSVGQVLKPGEITVTSIDDAFLKKVVDIVERKLGEEDFSIEDFASEVGMSRSQLLRKLTALTGLSPTYFLRYMRLHRAKDLLVKNSGTVSEIAYAVGFSGVSYFTKCFREQFGVLPSEVRLK